MLAFLFRFGPLLLTWGGLLLKLVRVIEKFHSNAPSEQKRAIAMEFVRAALDRAGIDNKQLLIALGHLVDMLVHLLHSRQEFVPVTAARTPVNVAAAAVQVAAQVNPAVAEQVAIRQKRDAKLDELEESLRR